jgi:hypothetical protein
VYSVGAVLSENLNGYVTWEGHDALENLASVHPTLPFSIAISQQLV